MANKLKHIVETPYGRIKTIIEKNNLWFAIGDYAHCIGLGKSFQISRKVPKNERLEVRETRGYYPTAYMTEKHLDVTLKYFRGREINWTVYKYVKDNVIPVLRDIQKEFFGTKESAHDVVIEKIEETKQVNITPQETIEALVKRISNLEKVIISIQAEKLSEANIENKKPDIQANIEPDIEVKKPVEEKKLEPIKFDLPKVIPLPRGYTPKEYDPGKGWRSWVRGMIHQILWRAQDLEPRCSISEQQVWSNLYKRVTTLTGYDLRDLRHELAMEFGSDDSEFALLDVLERQPNLRRIFLDGVLEMAERANLLDYKVSRL